MDITIIEHIDHTGVEAKNGINYAFFRGKRKFFYLYRATLQYIKKEKPDVVIVQGLIFPVQVIAIRLILGKKTRIIVQHHGELPYNGIRKSFQQVADRAIDAYIFTAAANAKIWQDNGNVRTNSRCYEVLEASTYFVRQDKEQSKLKLRISGNNNFLWVGRLDANKDPLAVLKGFEKHLNINPGAKLYMIYQYDGLLPEVKIMIANSQLLHGSVYLQGKIEHKELVYWYSACDFFISGSYKEGSGYALIEAMACGCIPVVTRIPSFTKIIENGKYGVLYKTGDADALFDLLKEIDKINKTEMSDKIVAYFSKHLSFQAIADGLYDVIKKLLTE